MASNENTAGEKPASLPVLQVKALLCKSDSMSSVSATQIREKEGTDFPRVALGPPYLHHGTRALTTIMIIVINIIYINI